MSANNWKDDKCVKNWFELIGNERTISNYSHDFPKFLAWAYENTPYKSPSEIIQSRIKSLTSTATSQIQKQIRRKKSQNGNGPRSHKNDNVIFL